MTLYTGKTEEVKLSFFSAYKIVDEQPERM